MFIDARTLSEDTVIESEVCIIGAGRRTTLAREFIGQDCRVGTQCSQEGKIIEEPLKIFINRSVASLAAQPTYERSNR